MSSIIDKKKTILTVVAIGFVCIMLVLLTAFAAELRHQNNALIKQNKALQGEVDTLDVQIQAKTSIARIEDVAMNELGMVYPTSEECVYLTEDDAPEGNFAAVLKEDAYN